MNIKITGTFDSREEMEHQKDRIKNILLAIGNFSDVKAHEDLITGEFHFECSTEESRS